MIPLYELLKLKFPNADFLHEILLGANDETGEGSEIKSWNYKHAPQPSPEDLERWRQEYDLSYRQNQVRELRDALYPTWKDQFDMQYKDKINNSDVWVKTIEAIKSANPIPQK